MMKHSLKCRIFGHKWLPVYIGKRNQWAIIACYCDRCKWGYQDLNNALNILGYEKGYDFGSYDEKYFIQEVNKEQLK